MKLSILGGAIFVLSGVGALAALTLFKTPPAPVAATESQAPAAASETVVFHVPDMSCEVVCVPTVRKTLAALAGVEKVETDLENHTATLLTSGAFDESKALAALSEAGYPAERTAN